MGFNEETEVKSKKDLIEKWELAIESAEFYGKGKEERLISYMRSFVDDLKQLDEPETLSQEWLDNNDFYDHRTAETVLANAVDKGELGYYGTKYSVVKKEPETVADVVTTFWKSYERLREVMSVEVEELEE